MSLSFDRLNNNTEIFRLVKAKYPYDEVQKIYYNPDYNANDIEVDDYSEIITSFQYAEIRKKYRLNTFQIKKLKSYLKKNDKSKINSSVVEKAYDELFKIANENLKSTLIFNDKSDKHNCIIPSITKKWFGTLYVAAPSGAGKSFFINRF